MFISVDYYFKVSSSLRDANEIYISVSKYYNVLIFKRTKLSKTQVFVVYFLLRNLMLIWILKLVMLNICNYCI